MKKISFFPFFFIFLFLFLVKTQNGKAATCPPAPPTPSCDFCSSYVQTQYRCNSQCPNAKIEKREKTCWSGKTCSPQEIIDENGCVVSWKCVNCTSCASCGEWSSPQKVEDCQAWQDCGSSEWSWSKNVCKCAGPCLETPKNQRYYDNPNYSDRPDKDVGNVNIKLPVKLDWDDVQYWQASPDGPRSYKITIKNTTKGDYSKVLTQSEYNYREDSNGGACFLKSNFTHNWQVKACCNPDGTNCQEDPAKQLRESFITNPAPEPIEPIDPDWDGEKEGNIPLNVTLKWCESDFKYPNAEGPMAYKLFFCQKDESGKDICHPLQKRDEECNLTKCPSYLLMPEPGSPSLYPSPEFSNEKYAYFTKDTSYAWKVAACKDSSGNECTDYSQRWRFQTTGRLEAPSLTYPPNDRSGEKPVGIPIVFRWAGSFGSASFVYEVYDAGGKKIYNGKNTLPNFGLDIPPLLLNKKYSWKVQPCWDINAVNCENVWAESYFGTTGRPPKPESMKTESPTDIFIPVNFEWENVPGAKSYRIKIQGNGLALEKPINESKFSLDYPDLRQEKNYSWQVKTCAKENGEVCGEWSTSRSFKTFRLSAPTNPSPSEGGKILTSEVPKTFSWNSVSSARYYQYKIDYKSKSAEETGDCPTGEIVNKIIDGNSDMVTLKCLGDYQWQVKACLDKDCNETGDWSLANFAFAQPVEACKPSLVPCGRICDVSATPWNERESCQFKHIFILLRTLIDFFLWRIGLIILVLLVVASAVIYYFSMGAPATIINVKSIWRSAGIGYGILFLAWIIVNLLLAIFGYKVGVFGHWWEIKF